MSTNAVNLQLQFSHDVLAVVISRLPPPFQARRDLLGEHEVFEFDLNCVACGNALAHLLRNCSLGSEPRINEFGAQAGVVEHAKCAPLDTQVLSAAVSVAAWVAPRLRAAL